MVYAVNQVRPYRVKNNYGAKERCTLVYFESITSELAERLQIFSFVEEPRNLGDLDKNKQGSGWNPFQGLLGNKDLEYLQGVLDAVREEEGRH
ncbi:MAG: hypothetical protein F6J87_27940 [Spirulina sp. SIO3F2]|nr:hypothetical protein [Spirulina sp. SIO3F2]